ncbi:DUF3105 domain-containing protein [Nocardioides sp. YIM 152588]|uniref:DUF3105 domain-containing protein n=1 Tax=Nocardioides sp. YIM 152588 TaxID=3158259 RepID=UPI0032E4FEDC
MSEAPPPPPPAPPGSYPAYPPPPYPPPGHVPPPAPRRRRGLPVVLAVAAALAVLAVAVVVPVVTLAGDEDGGPAAGFAAADLDDVVVYEDLSRDHLSGPIDYPQEPPVGGPHAPVWLDCGAYDAQVPAENLVHDLEHGTVVISYLPGEVDAAGVAALTAWLPANGILTPWPEQESPVVITVWGRQLALTGPDDERIGLFIEAYGDGSTSPEPFASCAGGIRPGGGKLT